MDTAKIEVAALLKKLPDDCSLEDIQYHLYVLEKIKKGIDSVQTHGSISQQEANDRLKNKNLARAFELLTHMSDDFFETARG